MSTELRVPVKLIPLHRLKVLDHFTCSASRRKGKVLERQGKECSIVRLDSPLEVKSMAPVILVEVPEDLYRVRAQEDGER